MGRPRLAGKAPAYPKHETGPNCEGCPFREKSIGFHYPTGPEDARVVCVGEKGGPWENVFGAPFMAGSGAELNGWLNQANLFRTDVYLTNAVHCRVVDYEKCKQCSGGGYVNKPGTTKAYACPVCGGEQTVPKFTTEGDYVDTQPSYEQIEECTKRYLHHELESLTDKRLIVAMGASALYALTGETDIGESVGYTFTSPYGKVLAMWHPAWVLRKQGFRRTAHRVFRRLPAIISNIWERFTIEGVKDPTEADIEETIAASKANDFAAPSVDLETTGGGNPTSEEDRITQVSISPHGMKSILVSEEALRESMENVDAVIGQNFYIYDAWWFWKKGIRVPPKIIDTLVLSHAANPSTPNNLGAITEEYAYPAPPPEYWKTKEMYAEHEDDVAIIDTAMTYRSLVGLKMHLEKQDQWGLAEENLIPMAYIAFDMRRNGMKLDLEALNAEEKIKATEARAVGLELVDKTGIELPKKSKTGLPSHQAVKKHLYDTLGLPKQYSRKEHKLTTDKLAMNRLLRQAREEGRKDVIYFIETLQRGQAANSMAINYRKYEVETGRIHAKLLLGTMDDGSEKGGTVTGRLSYRDPSLHQVPKYARRMFVADSEEHVYIQADYRQIELAVLMYLVESWDMLKVYVSGGDFHQATADKIVGVEELAKSMGKGPRAVGKLANFAVVNGQSPTTTSDMFGIPQATANALQSAIYGVLPGLRSFQKQLVKEVRKRGYYRNVYNWIRYFEEQKGRDEEKTTNIENEIKNTPIQGIAGMRTRYALVDVFRELPNWDDVELRATVHDSILLHAPKTEVGRVVEMLRDVMGKTTKQLPAPQVGHPEGLRFGVDIEVGPTWGDVIPYEEWKGEQR